MNEWMHAVGPKLLFSVTKVTVSKSYQSRECSGSVVECLTRDRRVVGSSLIGVTALCP